MGSPEDRLPTRGGVPVSVVIAVVVGILLGAGLVWAIWGLGKDPRVDRLDKSVRELSLQVLGLQVSLTSVAGPRQKEQAKEEYLAESARAAGLTPPTPKEVEEKKLTEETKTAEQTEVKDASDKLAKDTKSLNVPDCQKLLAQVHDLKAAETYDKVTSKEGAAQLETCKKQLDAERERLKRKVEECKQKAPDTDECKQAQRDYDNANDAEKILRILMVAAAIYLIVSGDDPELGLLLLAMANGHSGGGGAGEGDGNAGPGKGNGPGDKDQPGAGQTDGKSGVQSDSNAGQTQPAALPHGGTIGDITNSDLSCDPVEENKLVCWRDAYPDVKEKIDPMLTVPSQDLKKDSTRSNIASLFAKAIAGKTLHGTVFCLKSDAKPRDPKFIKGIMFHAEAEPSGYYEIGIEDSGSEAILHYPDPTPSQTMPDCSELHQQSH